MTIIQTSQTFNFCYLEEDIIDDSSVQDLLRREPDAPIFTRLGLTYGKAVKFRKEFGERLQSLPSRPLSPLVKPTMAAIASFTPETKRLYLSKRKKVGVLATEKWGPEFPKFNSPQMKAELNEFSAKIAPICSIPEVGFNEEGIAKHIQDFCNEQRRYLKLKRSKSASSEDNEVDDQPKKKKIQQKSASHEDSKSETQPQPTKKKNAPKVDENKDNDRDFNDTQSTLSLDTTESDRESSGDENLCSPQLLKDVNPGPRLPALCTYNLKACQVIFKAVFGKSQVDREDVVKVLKKKFVVKQERLTSLTMTQLMEVLAKKLVNQRYCSIKDGPETNIANLKMEDIAVHKEIAL